MLFTNKKKQVDPVTTVMQDKIAKGIFRVIINVQVRWVVFMERQAGRLSVGGRIVAFTLFCLLTLSASSYMVINSLLSQPAITNTRHLNPPQTNMAAIRNEHSNRNIITGQEYQQLLQFRRYMDSLARSPGGRQLYENIIKQRPGLLDSISFIEKIYRSQINNQKK